MSDANGIPVLFRDCGRVIDASSTCDETRIERKNTEIRGFLCNCMYSFCNRGRRRELPGVIVLLGLMLLVKLKVY